MPKAFFDTNVLIYAVSQNDPRSDQAEELLAAGGIVSVQVLNEFASVARRKLAMSWAELTAALAAILELCPNALPMTLETHQAAMKISERFSYGIYDSLIVASATEAGCTTLYSEDFRDGQTIGGKLTIRNPFRRKA